MNLEQRARLFATQHHEAIGQKRKYTNEPYINHPEAVVEIVRSVPHTEAMLAASWLCATVKYTAATIGDIFIEFGSEVAELVEMLTDISKPSDGNREIRKTIDREHTAKANPAAKTIKLAALIDNTRNIAIYDPKFALVYISEKSQLLKVLKEGNPTLHDIAYNIALDYLKSISRNKGHHANQ